MSHATTDAAPSTAASTTRRCDHCGTPYRPRQDDERFCCAGCEYVHRLLHDRGLTRFYDLKDRPLQPVSSAVFHAGENLEWLDAMARKAEAEAAPEAPATLELGLTGISCVGCVWLIQKIFDDQPGNVRLNVNAQLGRARLQWERGAFEIRIFAQELQRFGYRLGQAGEETSDGLRGLPTRIGVCAFLALNAMLFTLPRYLGMSEDFEYARLFEILTAVFATLSLSVGGSYFIERAFRGLRRGVLHIDLPIALGLVVAWLGSLVGWLVDREALLYFDFVSVFVFLMLVGRWLQEAAVERNRSRLVGQRPDLLRVQSLSDPAAALAVDALSAGMRIIVKPGQVVPVRCRLLQEDALLSLEWINGESEPRTWTAARAVPAGAINIATTALALEVQESWQASLLSRLLVNQGDSSRNPGLERVLKIYLGIVLALAAIGGLGWLWLTGAWPQALEVFVAVLVVSCPCALGVAWPLTEEIASTALRRCGVYLREASMWARLKRIRQIFFDKTGTLTLESPRLKNPEALLTLSPGNRQMLFRLIEHSLHPVGRSLREALLKLPDFEPAAYPDTRDERLNEVTGQGVRLATAVGRWTLGRPGWADTDTIEADTVFAHNGKVLAGFSFEDAVRRDAADELARLRKRGFSLCILSGDRQEKVDTLAQSLGLEPARALGNLSPEQKRAHVQDAGGSSVLMVGDGANDSLAFDAAGVRATPVVDKGLLEQKADFYFLGQDLSGIESVLQVGRRRSRALRRVFAFTVSYNVAAVTLALAGLMNPLLAAILMPLSSLVSVGLAAAGMRR
ncbi:MAG: heavy metal translocating P-type ATPase metal-binding domain-containing protein [Opitutales bacterium]